MLHLETVKRSADGTWTVETHDAYFVGQTYLDDRLGWYTVIDEARREVYLGTEFWRNLYTLTCRPATPEEVAAREAEEEEAERRDREWRAGARERALLLAAFGSPQPTGRDA